MLFMPSDVSAWMMILSLSFLVTLLDQLSKHIVRLNLHLGEHVTVVAGFLDLRYGMNTGAAMGSLQGLNSWLILVSVIMLGLIVVFRGHFLTSGATPRIALSLIIAGILGNLSDRVRLGFVVDFLDFYWRDYHFWTFNVADAAICVGVGLYVLSQFRSPSGAPGVSLVEGRGSDPSTTPEQP